MSRTLDDLANRIIGARVESVGEVADAVAWIYLEHRGTDDDTCRIAVDARSKSAGEYSGSCFSRMSAGASLGFPVSFFAGFSISFTCCEGGPFARFLLRCMSYTEGGGHDPQRSDERPVPSKSLLARLSSSTLRRIWWPRGTLGAASLIAPGQVPCGLHPRASSFLHHPPSSGEGSVCKSPPWSRR